MSMPRPRFSTLSALFFLGLCSSEVAPAGILMAILDQGGNVTLTASGTVNTTGLTAQFNTFWTAPALDYQHAEVGSGISKVYTGLSGPSVLGPGPGLLGQLTSDTAGDPFGISSSNSPLRFFLPLNYVSGAPIFGTAIFHNTSVAGLGLAPGTYTYTWGSGIDADSFTVQITEAPEPGTWALFGTAGSILALLRRRSAGNVSHR